MSPLSDSERAMAQFLVTVLNLENVTPDEIAPEAPLFSHEAGGLGLDSIDALEIALGVQQKYGVELRADDESNKQIFGSLRALCAYVQSRRPA